MCALVIIPGILRARSGSATVEYVAASKKVVSVQMPVDKSSDQSGMPVVSDEALLIKLYEQYRHPIHAYAYRLLNSREDADDVTQEVFIRACTSWDNLTERDKLSAWLYRIATNLCVDLLRRRKRISWWPLGGRVRSDESSDEYIATDLTAFLADDGGIPEVAERELIRMALSHMPVDYAVVLVLSAAQGVPYQEIADIVGLSPNATATRISRAKKMFAEHYIRLTQRERVGQKDGIGQRGKRI